MKITQNVKEFVAKEGVSEEKALVARMSKKLKDFVTRGREIYQVNLPERA